MKITWIEQGLLSAGGIPISLENVQSLHHEGIRAIVTLTEHPLTIHKELSSEVFASLNIELFHVPIVDQTPPKREQAEQVTTFIDAMAAQGKPVYVHCHAGIGRTGTVLHAYYLLKGKTLNETKVYIQRTRPVSQFMMLSDTQKAFLEDLAYG